MTSADLAASDNAPAPRWVERAWLAAVFALTALLHTIAFPPYNVPEGAYVFAVAGFLWAARAPHWKTFLGVVYVAALVSWLTLLSWMWALLTEGGPIALVGWVALSAVMALFPTAWFAALRWIVPRALQVGATPRVLALFALAGAWVLLEWVRSWFLTGFPWLTLAASQWQRPVMLQGAAYTGAWGVSFALIFFNLGLAAYLRRLYLFAVERKRTFCPEFYLALVAIFVCSFLLYRESVGQRREPVFKAGLMQPYIPQSAKWDPEEAGGILEILESQTDRLKWLDPDVVFWPEAVSPLVFNADPIVRSWVERVAREIERPIVFGAVGVESDGGDPFADEDARWFNAVMLVDPDTGVQQVHYQKRRLVPFGEYVPLRRWLPFVEKLVPIGGDFAAGTDAQPLSLRAGGRTTRIGPLICYEDVFPSLARASAQAGAQILFVATNNAWFGEGAAAYQHAAHSVLRAVETRRPLIRAGNGGWSGWIDEYGIIRAVLTGPDDRIYFRGSSTYTIDRDIRWTNRQSLYVRWGDWFVAFCALLILAGYIALRRAELRARQPL